MKSSRNQLLAKIAVLNKNLISRQITLAKHKKYLTPTIGGENITTLVMLLPAFITGWKMARMQPEKNRIKKILKFVSLTSVTIIKSLKRIILF